MRIKYRLGISVKVCTAVKRDSVEGNIFLCPSLPPTQRSSKKSECVLLCLSFFFTAALNEFQTCMGIEKEFNTQPFAGLVGGKLGVVYV